MPNSARSRDKSLILIHDGSIYMNQGKNPVLVGKKLTGKKINENWHISTILKKVYSVIQHHSRLNAYLLLVPCQGLISYSVATSPMMYELAFGLARTLFFRPCSVCNTSNEITISYKTKQLPESSSHSESFKCTRGQRGEEWPEETRLRHIQSSCSWLDLHSW